VSSSAFYLPRVWAGSQLAPKLLPRSVRPLSAHVKLTENCQAKCISCDYWKTRWQDALNTEQAVDLLNQIAGAGIRSLRLTGGEPLLRKDLFEVLKKADNSSFKNIILQTNGLLLMKLHKEVNDSPITKVAVSVDGLEKTNDLIRGIHGYFSLALEGIKLLRGKKTVLSVTLNKLSAMELSRLREAAHDVGAEIETNILSDSLFFLKHADVAAMWPEAAETKEIVRFVRDDLQRPSYEVEYMEGYYQRAKLEEPACVLGFLQMFVLSNGDVLTGCYPLPPVGNVLRQSLASILASDAYYQQSLAMLRRECPGCTCGVESSLAVKHAGSSAIYELSKLLFGARGRKHGEVQREVAAAAVGR
jgi:MoaA/NifB/PqqE/SkfB family radical SAM enzyme